MICGYLNSVDIWPLTWPEAEMKCHPHRFHCLMYILDKHCALSKPNNLISLEYEHNHSYHCHIPHQWWVPLYVAMVSDRWLCYTSHKVVTVKSNDMWNTLNVMDICHFITSVCTVTSGGFIWPLILFLFALQNQRISEQIYKGYFSNQWTLIN